MTYWYGKKFEKWEDAVEYQRERLTHCLANGWPIRECSITDELDYDTKIRWYCVYVRPFYLEGAGQGDNNQAFREERAVSENMGLMKLKDLL